jgi:non-homologous end joining protein Ku
MRASSTSRRDRRADVTCRARPQPLDLLAIVDGDRLPPRCLDDTLTVAADDGGCEKAYEALCDALSRNHQVGLTTVSLDGEPRVAALLPIGGVLAITPLRREYAAALADGLREADAADARTRAAA